MNTEEKNTDRQKDLFEEQLEQYCKLGDFNYNTLYEKPDPFHLNHLFWEAMGKIWDYNPDWRLVQLLKATHDCDEWGWIQPSDNDIPYEIFTSSTNTCSEHLSEAWHRYRHSILKEYERVFAEWPHDLMFIFWITFNNNIDYDSDEVYLRDVQSLIRKIIKERDYLVYISNSISRKEDRIIKITCCSAWDMASNLAEIIASESQKI